MKNAKLRKPLNLYGELRCNLKICNLQSAICNSRRGGFTLIEVIVAIAILAISLVMVMQLFSSGLKASRTSCDYTRAIVHAKDKMEELSLNPDPVQDSGKFEDGFRWESEVLPYEELNEKLEEYGYNLLKIKVKVLWSNILNQEKSFELITLKAMEKKE